MCHFGLVTHRIYESYRRNERTNDQTKRVCMCEKEEEKKSKWWRIRRNKHTCFFALPLLPLIFFNTWNVFSENKSFCANLITLSPPSPLPSLSSKTCYSRHFKHSYLFTVRAQKTALIFPLNAKPVAPNEMRTGQKAANRDEEDEIIIINGALQ